MCLELFQLIIKCLLMGGGKWVRVQLGSMEKFGIILIPLSEIYAIYKLIEFFLPVITTGFDR